MAFYRVRWWTLPVCYSVNVRHGQCHSSTKAVALLMQLLRCAILLNESCVLHLTLTLSVLCRGPTREELKDEVHQYQIPSVITNSRLLERQVYGTIRWRQNLCVAADVTQVNSIIIVFIGSKRRSHISRTNSPVVPLRHPLRSSRELTRVNFHIPVAAWTGFGPFSISRW